MAQVPLSWPVIRVVFECVPSFSFCVGSHRKLFSVHLLFSEDDDRARTRKFFRVVVEGELPNASGQVVPYLLFQYFCF